MMAGPPAFDHTSAHRRRLTGVKQLPRLPPCTPKIFRYAYPDGPHDAEAILLTAPDTPIFVTKDPFTARVYGPAGPADPSGDPVPLKRVGTVTVTPSSTPNGLGILGTSVLDGGAQTADRRKVAPRTYADVYEWAVPDGDVVRAITTTAATKLPLANEPFGESIAYGPEGTALYTVSDIEKQPVKTPILRYRSAVTATPVAPVATSSPARRGAPTAAASEGRRGAAYPIILLVSALALGLAAAGVAFAVTRSHRRARPT